MSCENKPQIIAYRWRSGSQSKASRASRNVFLFNPRDFLKTKCLLLVDNKPTETLYAFLCFELLEKIERQSKLPIEHAYRLDINWIFSRTVLQLCSRDNHFTFPEWLLSVMKEKKKGGLVEELRYCSCLQLKIQILGESTRELSQHEHLHIPANRTLSNSISRSHCKISIGHHVMKLLSCLISKIEINSISALPYYVIVS